MGSFDLWAWQFLWIAGIWLGVRWGKGDLPIEAGRAERDRSVSAISGNRAFRDAMRVAGGFELGQDEFCLINGIWDQYGTQFRCGRRGADRWLRPS